MSNSGMSRINTRLIELARCETFRTYYGYNGKCPCNYEYCDNKGSVLPKPINFAHWATLAAAAGTKLWSYK